MPPIIYILIAVAVIIVAAIVAAVLIIVSISKKPGPPEDPVKQAGDLGERYASNLIKSYLTDSDILLTNVPVVYDGNETELDSVVINSYGVFIFEVKYYTGMLRGSEDDYEWEKYHVSAAHNVYQKTVKNPIKQVNRQIYILAGYLRSCGVNVWVNGYTILLGADSPVQNDHILNRKDDLGKIIHTPGEKRLYRGTIDKICSLLSDN